MPGWSRRSWSMALWPPLAAYLPKVESVHTCQKYEVCIPSQSIIIIDQQYQHHQNPRHHHLALTWGLWLLLDFESWLVDHCPALLLPSIYDHVKGYIMILVIMFGVGNSQNSLMSHPLQIPQNAGSPEGQQCHCMGIGRLRELFNSIWLTLGHPLIVEFLNNILCKKAFWTNIWKNKSICK